MLESKSLLQTEPDPSTRKLKIEADGDPYKGGIKPKIRIMGRWLERAGFRPGSHVHITFVAPGIIQVRSSDSAPAREVELSSPCEPCEGR